MTQASAQNNPRQKKKEVPNDVQVLESLKDELSVHAFWIETEWQKWSIQSFDAAAVKLNPGITKANAHLDLTYDINIILKALKDKASRRCLRLKQMKNDLKTIGKDKINNHFWREQVVSEALVESEEKAMKRKRAVAEECFAVATLEKMTNQTQELVGAKRSIEQVGESSSSTPKRQEMTSPLKERHQADNGENDEEKADQDCIMMKIRQQLFQKAFDLKAETNMDRLNALSLCLLQNWPLQDEILEQILRISLCGIVDKAHDWVSTYMKRCFKADDWDNLDTLPHHIHEFDSSTNAIFDHTIKILKGKAKTDGVDDHVHETQQALIYLAEQKVVEIRKKTDSPVLQIIDVLEASIKNGLYRSSTSESELDCMEDCYSILKIIFRGKK